MDLYRGRAAVEREFGRLKHEWALLPFGFGGSSGPLGALGPRVPECRRREDRAGPARYAGPVMWEIRCEAGQARAYSPTHQPARSLG